MSESLHFDIHPSVIFQLGADLVTDDLQALQELLKNAYDANAKSVDVVVSTDSKPETCSLLKGLPLLFPEAESYLVIKDTGDGMSYDQVKTSWMVISNSLKRIFKANVFSGGRKKTERRMPLGDKGLGRLATQLLGYNVELFTWQTPEAGTHVAFSWRDFYRATKLSEVQVYSAKLHIPAPVAKLGKSASSGTIIVVSELRDPSLWIRRRDDSSGIAERMIPLISPFGGVRDYKLRLAIDSLVIPADDIGESLDALSQIKYVFSCVEHQLSLNGGITFDAFRPKKEELLNLYLELVSDSAKRNDFRDKIIKWANAKFSTTRFRKGEGRWWIEWSTTIELGDFPQYSTESADDAGPFEGKLASFDFVKSDSLTAVKKLGNYWGTYLYRDGFGIRVERDFLRLSHELTRGRSYYSLKLGNVIAYINISAHSNPQLEEKADREGFKDSGAYRNFTTAIQAMTKRMNEELEFLRRSSIEILTGNGGAAGRTKAKSAGKQLTAAIQTAMDSTVQLSLDPAATLDKIRSSLEHAKTLAVSEIGRQSVIAVQMQQIQEMIGLGIAAEGLAHELVHIAENITLRARKFLASKMTQVESNDFGKFILTSATGLRRQLTLLEPSLRISRESKEIIDVGKFLDEMKSFYEARLKAEDVHLVIQRYDGRDLVVRTGRGKLFQIFDNLVRNSRYWISTQKEKGAIGDGTIRIEIESPYVWFSDSGPGFSKSIEGMVFDEPFITRKPSGRGLGLYIVSAFMREMGGAVSFYEERNASGKYYAIQLDFSGAIKR